MKRILLSILLILWIGTTAYAAEDRTPEADYLNGLGLLRGDSDGYGLDNTLTRAEGAVMIVRLLGEEVAAVEENYGHPFGDVPGWADPYVGYLYRESLTNGQSETYFGAYDLMTEAQYMTFLLRVLGYDDGQGDFHWSQSMSKAREIGMIDVYTQSSSSNFKREAMAHYTFLCLQTSMKKGHDPLLDWLEAKGALPPVIETADLIYDFDTREYHSAPINLKALAENLAKMIYDLDTEASFDLRHIEDLVLGQVIDMAKEEVSQVPIYSSLLSRYQMNRTGNTLEVTMAFNNTAEEVFEAKKVARTVVAGLIKTEMTDFERELAIHDYIVNRVTYDTSSSIRPSAYTIYGALVENNAVCHGYAESFQYMAYLAGLESEIVLGDAIDGSGKVIGHAWNMVTINGKKYHIDTTWDDPVMADGSQVLSYSYFNLSDSVMKKDHVWDEALYDPCTATADNYYVHFRMVVYSKSQLQDYMQEAFNEGNSDFSVRLIGDPLTVSDIQVILNSCNGYGHITYRVDSGNNVVTIDSIS